MYHTLVRPCSGTEVRVITRVPRPNPHLSVLTPAFSGLPLLSGRTTSVVSQSGEALTKYNLRNILYAVNFNRIININLIISPVVCIFHSNASVLLLSTMKLNLHTVREECILLYVLFRTWFPTHSYRNEFKINEASSNL